jgi:hypothetical protein
MSEYEHLIDQYRQLHAKGRYGDTSVKRIPAILPLVRLANPNTVIDYGCGQSQLSELVAAYQNAEVTRYDPAIPAYAEHPSGRFDLLISTDVLEHVPQDAIDRELAAMRRLADKAIIIIDTRPAKQVLPDGRNAHVSLFSVEKWQTLLRGHWDCVQRMRWVQKRPASFATWPVGRAAEAGAIAEMLKLQAQRFWALIKTNGIRETMRRI